VLQLREGYSGLITQITNVATLKAPSLDERPTMCVSLATENVGHQLGRELKQTGTSVQATAHARTRRATVRMMGSASRTMFAGTTIA